MNYSSEQKNQQPKNLPDVALEQNQVLMTPLSWVGMSQIQIPILWSEDLKIPAHVDAQVSLDLKPSRGIHMSRLYLMVQSILTLEKLSLVTLEKLLDGFLESHQDLSSQARVSLNFELPFKRQALKSHFEGWRSYPVRLVAQKNPEGVQFFVEVSVIYSSTCPASAALARQISKEEFQKRFPSGAPVEEIMSWLTSAEGLPATPHAQRSLGQVVVQVQSEQTLEFIITNLIDAIEGSLKTPVQAAVKREDEQEFARLNGQNLMFCEDAGRRVKATLEKIESIKDYFGKFEHFESLHPHNAVSFIQKSSAGLNGFI